MTTSALWAAIADTLRNEIASHHYAPGDKLPTEAALAKRFGVNRHTVRHGLKALTEEGLIITRRGAGAFVAMTPTVYPIGRRVRFHQNLTAARRIPTKKVLSLETRGADEKERSALRLPPDAQVHVYSGLSLADDQPIALFTSVFPAARFPDLPRDIAALTSVTKALARHGVADYTRAETRLTAKSATFIQAVHLRIQEGAPILRTTSINHDLDGAPIEYGTTWFAGDRVTLTVGGEEASSRD
ncbi:MAG: phosphonate metabolism transcriptional regulator PhnF [Yoonia sp.]|uniref:phosphonate metabolism transcriptional regulator PhnF n=1 Tax=Yoonia sp. TaxID=2212373 RepID=UPI0027400721|nr:phosphonate metabolism transcriptional regulator PhnF [Yoonia sp.]MDP5086240.1 phosphonate metabolism transcriptional regulator PhnF [Yoonia sp.]MDP5360005.1 phosphonate metabolism transcriptional regulator PhnF [Paracoccaceae bacterium]MDP5362632.1 phosphonate metabolism transcriptional regulator PhnF [Paracoccaceae bacterium]